MLSTSGVERISHQHIDVRSLLRQALPPPKTQHRLCIRAAQRQARDDWVSE